MSYLITCAGSKKNPTNTPSALINLSFPQLNPVRISLIGSTGIILDWSKTLPAWELYSGRRSKLYPQVSSLKWQNTSHDIMILSALFGWIKHTDRIPYYDLKMTDQIISLKIPVWKFWLQNGKLNGLVGDTDIDLLSENYRKAITSGGIICASKPNVNFTDYGIQKGRWLALQL